MLETVFLWSTATKDNYNKDTQLINYFHRVTILQTGPEAAIAWEKQGLLPYNDPQHASGSPWYSRSQVPEVAVFISKVTKRTTYQAH